MEEESSIKFNPHHLIDLSIRILGKLAFETDNPSQFFKDIAKGFWQMAKEIEIDQQGFEEE